MSEHLLVAIEDDGDAGEHVAVETHDNVVELRRADGSILRLDRVELRAALDDLAA